MIQFSVHNATIEIDHEFVENGHSLQLRINGDAGIEFTIYCKDREEWWRLRHAFPKGPGYRFHLMGDHPGIADHSTADHLAFLFHAKGMERMREAALRVPDKETAA